MRLGLMIHQLSLDFKAIDLFYNSPPVEPSGAKSEEASVIDQSLPKNDQDFTTSDQVNSNNNIENNENSKPNPSTHLTIEKACFIAIRIFATAVFVISAVKLVPALITFSVITCLFKAAFIIAANDGFVIATNAEKLRSQYSNTSEISSIFGFIISVIYSDKKHKQLLEGCLSQPIYTFVATKVKDFWPQNAK